MVANKILVMIARSSIMTNGAIKELIKNIRYKDRLIIQNSINQINNLVIGFISIK